MPQTQWLNGANIIIGRKGEVSMGCRKGWRGVGTGGTDGTGWCGLGRGGTDCTNLLLALLLQQ